MPVTTSYLELVVDRLEEATSLPLRTKAMFGGVGIYAGAVIFAIVMDDRLYFKVDDTNRGDYEAAGMEAFRPYANKEVRSKSSYEVPTEVLNNGAVLKAWVAKSLDVAQQKSKQRKPKGNKKRAAQ